MKIKKYIGNTAHEAMIQMKKELGPDAVVLNTKTVRAKGVFGYFKRAMIEITAAYEEKDIIMEKSNTNYDKKLNNISDELIELKKIIKEFPLNKQLVYNEPDDNNLPELLKGYYNRMVDNGINPNISLAVLKDINEEINLNEKDKNTIENIIKYNLLETLGDPQPITINEEQKVIFFVGATGVGKTTTLAKIAASLVMQKKYKIGMITADTYRIAAVDQLRIYSDILELPLEIAYNTEDMTKAYDLFKDKDIILVDTAGRNHNDIEQVEELKSIVNTISNKEVYLLLNATTDFNILKSLIKRYEFLGNFKIIITKVDEAENYGNIFNVRYITDKELSYYTTGQNVPDDINIIDKEEILKELIKESNKNGSSWKTKKNDEL